ncbi:hypothetical protein M569_14565 [Genlisea aurea]|uniref:Uncharacterized protein n=1 Tax=Genlisea aurea TaxID=192259 RepID=S8C0R6_9LAMI|nr:hypothetical protein M569_14565 [Genlisea aurea]
MAEDILIAVISFLFASLLLLPVLLKSVSVMVCSDWTFVCTWTEQYVSFKLLTLFA